MKSNAKKKIRKSSILKRKKEDIGLSPYAVVFRGERKIEQSVIRIMQFNNEQLDEFELNDISKDILNPDLMTWMHVSGIHDVEQLRNLASKYEIPDYILSSVLDPSIRPKYEPFDQGIFITLKLLTGQEKNDFVQIENLSIIIKNNLLISFREDMGQVFDPIRERIRKFNNKIRSSGSDYLAFALIDVVFDNYVYALGNIGEKIEVLDEALTLDLKKEILEMINSYKREISLIRKNILPARDMIQNLLKSDSELLHLHNKVHFRELLNNIHDANELTDSYREILFDQMTIYHTTVSARLNEIMRTLTLFSVIFIPLTFIAGIYGMNFENMPELQLQNGYYLSLALMLIVAVGMLIYFLQKKWF